MHGEQHGEIGEGAARLLDRHLAGFVAADCHQDAPVGAGAASPGSGFGSGSHAVTLGERKSRSFASDGGGTSQPSAAAAHSLP